MNTTSKKLENAITEIMVTFDKEEWNGAREKATNKLAQNVKVDGFRPGKAPLAMVKARISESSIVSEATDILLQEKYMEVLTSSEITPIAQPSLSIENVDENGLTVKFLVPVQPTVELGTYKGLEVKKGRVTVAKKDIDARVESYQEQFAELAVKEGAVENGDTAVIDFEGFKDGVAFEGGKGENYPLEIGSGSFIPGFEEQVIGMELGSTKDVEVTFPEDYQATDLAGAAVTFKVTVHEVKVKQLPEIDDELAMDVNIEGVETLEQLKAHIKAELKSQKEVDVENAYNENLFKAIVAGSTVETSDALVSQECEMMLQEIDQNLQRQGMTFELYEQFTGKTKDDVLEDVKPQAVDRVKLNLILAAIVDAESLEVTEAETDAEIEEIAKVYNKEVAEVKQIFGANMDRIEDDLLMRKALQLVKDNLQ
ncbi:trigger factor [Tannockella kyphosi]|uniref:trigger factor n=1 Tax=Tannockella kyphosi TaxID=2899121 RepID=UPI00201366C8|nr:trigger factor [Tannockella kyphosi]